MVDHDAQRAQFMKNVGEMSKTLHDAIDSVLAAEQKQYALEIQLMRETANRVAAERRAKVSEDKLATVWTIVDEWHRHRAINDREHEELREAVARSGYDDGIDGVGL